MPVTITVNNLTLCHKGSDGHIKNTLPDICKTPSKCKPKEYDIVSYSKDLIKGTTTVEADGGNMCAILGSEFATCTGDEAGACGGVVSGTFCAESTWITYSPDVFMEGQPVCRLTDKMWMNHGNTVGMAGEVQANLDAGKILAGLCAAAKECNKKIDDKWKKAGKTLDPSNCRDRGAEKHKCTKKKIDDYNKKNPNSKMRAEPGFDAKGNPLDAKEAEKIKQNALNKAAEAKQEVYRQNGDLVTKRKKLLDRYGLGPKPSGTRTDTSKTIKGYAKRAGKFFKNLPSHPVVDIGLEIASNDTIDEVLRDEIPKAMDDLNKIEKQSSAAAAKAYNQAEGPRAIPDAVELKDPTKPPTKDNIKSVYDYKFNCPDWNGNPSKGVMTNAQRNKYKKILGKDTEVIHPETCQ